MPLTIYLINKEGYPIIKFYQQENGLWQRASDRERNLTEAEVIEEITTFLKGEDQSNGPHST